jgi:hypothetical protein
MSKYQRWIENVQGHHTRNPGRSPDDFGLFILYQGSGLQLSQDSIGILKKIGSKIFNFRIIIIEFTAKSDQTSPGDVPKITV